MSLDANGTTWGIKLKEKIRPKEGNAQRKRKPRKNGPEIPRKPSYFSDPWTGKLLITTTISRQYP
jgi:hypothetical protein